MSILRNLGKPPDSGAGSGRRRLFIWLAGTVAAMALAVVAAFYFDVATESDAFCGTICHANLPEYVSHKVSDHANVECSTCHIGPGLLPKIEAKISGVKELVAQLTNTYDRPIKLPVENMRPSSVICEQCHAPREHNEEQARFISHFANDEANSETKTYLELRTGASDAQAQPSIQWHLDHPVQYVALDPARQNISWVGVTENGKLVEYKTTDSSKPEQLATMPRQEMGCVDCHSRPTHQFVSPEASVDKALAQGRLDRSLPYIRREATRLLAASYASSAEALKAIAGLKEFYRAEYPEVFSGKQLAIEQAIAELQSIFSNSIFPDMNVNSKVYPDNLGHADFPGCFRCHDGQHLNEQGETIPLDCNTCHSPPLVIKDGQEPVALSIADLAAQAARTPLVPHLLTEKTQACLQCHDAGGPKPVPVTHQAIRLLDNKPCLLCHKAESVIAADAIPHGVNGLEACLVCHSKVGLKGLATVPADHAGRANESCLLCHETQ